MAGGPRSSSLLVAKRLIVRAAMFLWGGCAGGGWIPSRLRMGGDCHTGNCVGADPGAAAPTPAFAAWVTEPLRGRDLWQSSGMEAHLPGNYHEPDNALFALR